ncbi:hypothetical protein BRD00_08290 [Halobacteriales archaeon QS_8_69_26]|nr:MAG: hypothetical protein BRD00_08290 [Halobacteriales archaeon QS_8_69_26]
MDPFARGGRWLRVRRARRLLSRARHGPASGLDPAAVEELGDLLAADGSRDVAAEALEAIARTGEAGPARSRATDLLVESLADGDPDRQATAARSLRYVALRRPAVVPRLDDPYAAILADTRHGAHREVAVDAGMVLSRVDGAAADLPETRETLREVLAGGPTDARRSAAVAVVLAADRADAFEHPGRIAEGLAILRGRADGEVPGPGTAERRLAEGRTVADAVGAFRAAADGGSGEATAADREP